MKGVSERDICYLSALKKLGGKKIRLKDLANELDVSTPSAHLEIGHLSSSGIVTNSEGLVSLTKEGNDVIETLRCAHFAFETISLSTALRKKGCVRPVTLSSMQSLSKSLENCTSVWVDRRAVHPDT
ncbi:MAG: helix-turn-helix domain-containing protein [Nitrososphaerales archaeon]